jgi:hypothetical protein
MQTAGAFSSAIEKITSIFVDLEKAMPRFERWKKLFPKNKEFTESMSQLYDVYTTFLVDSILYLQRHPGCMEPTPLLLTKKLSYCSELDFGSI